VERKVYIAGFDQQLVDFTAQIAAQQLLVEFVLFMRKYLECKKLLQNEHDMDAYRLSLEALNHWARITVLEEGMTPEPAILKQVKTVNPGISKLYEELTSGKESVYQRVQLVLLACDFAVMSRMRSCCLPLIELLERNPGPVCVEELVDLEQFRNIRDDLPTLMDKLSERGFIRKVFVPESVSLDSLTLMYTS